MSKHFPLKWCTWKNSLYFISNITIFHRMMRLDITAAFQSKLLEVTAIYHVVPRSHRPVSTIIPYSYVPCVIERFGTRKKRLIEWIMGPKRPLQSPIVFEGPTIKSLMRITNHIWIIKPSPSLLCNSQCTKFPKILKNQLQIPEIRLWIGLDQIHRNDSIEMIFWMGKHPIILHLSCYRKTNQPRVSFFI